MTHLRELVRMPLPGDKLLRHGDRLLVGSFHGQAPRTFSVVGLAPTPHVVGQLPFAHQAQAITVVGDFAYVFEYGRAIHLVRLDQPTPVAEDCLLMFKQQICRFAKLGTRWLVLARNWEGVSVLDVSDPASPRETDQRKLGESYCEDVVVVGDRVFCAANRDGLVELRVDDQGRLVEVGRWLGGEDGFGVSRVFALGDTLWLFGDGVLPYAKPDEAKEEAEVDEDEGEDHDEVEAEEPDTVILPLDDLSRPRWFGTSGTQPRHLRALDDGSAITFEGYRCWHFTGRGKPALLFHRHERDDSQAYVEVPPGHHSSGDRRTSIGDDVTGWLRIGDQLYLKTTGHLLVYAIDPASPLARVLT